MALYTIYNGPAPTTAAQAVLLTGTTIKTHLQVKLGDTQVSRARIVEWGVSFNGDPTAVAAVDSAVCELFTTTVAATGMVAHAATSIIRLDSRDTVTADNFPFAYGVGDTAYGDASVTEGAVANVAMKDCVQVPINSWYVKQFPLDREPVIVLADYLRVRIHSPLTIGAICYVVIEV